jgi:acyl-CoA thioesterase-1
MPLKSARRTVIRLLVSAWCLAVGLWGGTPRAAEPPLQIVTLGDSITRGVRQGVAADETFSAYLEAALKKHGVAVQVVNVGIGGERTDQALVRLEKDVIAKKPRYVTIMYGTNDSYVDEGKKQPRLTVDEYRTHLTGIVDQLQSAGIHPILMTEPRWGKSAKNGLNESPNVRLEQFMNACRTLAKERKLPLVDHFSDWTMAEEKGTDIATWTTDECHPNPAGHRRMADLMLPVMLKAAGKTP